ncbi:glycosyltransferase [Mucilaginibacter sp. FT3.2]|uniref:glycosyltransferase n=1 Tax=Mucilaginibacter sp. FT3.2 TaxID=2723090 RepID=UPI00160C8086|nr:glycosyltransferase [Mucilaginibacter sp. FT3.2]MBB6234577.1 glycosyltransferase involved in cell wall biosynthesis [Mucilaginibacter sp. FT3.2]
MIQSSPKKILLMGHTDGLGGAQTAYRELFDFAKTAGYTVKIINLTDRAFTEQPFGQEAIIGVIEHKVSRPVQKIKKYASLISTGIKAKLYAPDIFVSIGLSNSSNFITQFLKGSSFKIAQDFIANRLQDEQIWITSRDNFNGIAVQAPSMLDYWKTTLTNATGINWLPCFPQPPVDDVLKTVDSKPKEKIKLAYFGRLAGNKGLSLLFKAIASLPSHGNISLDLWGKGEEEDELKKLAKDLRIQHKINFLGGYPGEKEGAELMASYDSLVLTSTEMEGLPLILLESMAYGLPFMATNIGAIKDCCKDNPDTILVQPTLDNITIGLYLLIKKIQNNEFDPARLKAYYEQNFSSKVMAARWKECFDNPKLFFS